ncbi:MAG TPA: hypothetical protein ENJ46_04330 [Hellea balneolensis]|uniref:Uncharacterized protein n=1 Tax=Hellea balneolensis TaxID=287478 RepID=A0A7C3G088_9PROT|nr:hypothetical protein [Hellea balneolensis]
MPLNLSYAENFTARYPDAYERLQMNPKCKHFNNLAKLTIIATDIVSARLLEDIYALGQASLLVSGGSTLLPYSKNYLQMIWTGAR